MKIFAITILILICALSVFPQRGFAVKAKNGRDVILYENSYALIIGNSVYKDGSWGNLPGVKEDIAAVSEILCRHGFNVEIAENLTSKTFEPRIKKFIDDYGKLPNNRILIYYAGHGFKQKSAGDNRDIGYVVPVDAPSPQKFDFVKTAVTMDTIETYAKLIQSKHALFVFDNCFSGKLVSRAPIIVPSEINQKVGGAVRQFLTSGTSDQEVPDASSFRRAFVRGLRGEADDNGDGYINASELAVFIKAALSGESISPQYGKINDDNLNIGDFTFARANQKADCVKKTNDGAENENLPDAKMPRVAESNFFKFQLNSCRISGSSLICDVAVTNLEADREIGFGSKSRVYDDLGNEYKAKRVSVGLKSGAVVYAEIINGVTANVQFIFENFSPNASRISKFEIYAAPRKSAAFNIEYRDISLGRPNRQSPEPVRQQFNENGFLFELNGCKKSGSLVYCDLTITNKGIDREIGFGSLTKMFDELGNTYPSRQINIALKAGTTIYADFISNVRVKVRFTFENVALEANKIQMLNVLVAPRGGKSFNVIFKNVGFE